MIISDNIDIKTNPSTYKYYKNLGYTFNCGDTIKILISELPKNSHTKINCKCSNCEEVKLVSYKNYNLQISRNTLYCCSKCRYTNTKKTMMKKYGVDHFNNQEKATKTCKDRYGESSYSKTNDFKNKIKLNSLAKFGVDNPSKSELIKEKKKETLLKKYGVDNYFKTLEFREFIKNLFINRYGVDNPFKSKHIIDLIREKNIKSGFWVSDENYKSYRRKVDYLTNKNKSTLLKNWNGYDYYDNEYIKENFSLDKNDNNYPSIDHKIPVSYGYINGINVNDISNIENLCITKRIINSYKRNIIENEFKL